MVEKEGLDSLLMDITETARVISDYVEAGKTICIESHLDADGLAAAGIMGVALKRLGARFYIRIERWLDGDIIKSALSGRADLVIFTDMGSGYLDLFRESVEKADASVMVLDHHQPVGEAPKGMIHINPHLHGIDGSRDLSGSGIAYLVAKGLSGDNRDLAYLGVVGSLGDIQDKYENHRLGGVNEIIVRDAVESGYLKTEIDLLLFGRETRPIHKALAYTANPFIPGISGREDESLALLTSLGIKLKEGERWRALRDLSMEEKRKLSSALAERLTSMGFKGEVAMNLLGTIYILTKEEPWTPLRDAREFALLLNATGRMDKPGVGVAICMGDRGRSLEEANKVLEDYRSTIMKYLNWLNENPEYIEELENIYVLHGENIIDEKVISTISTILSSNLPKPEKPVIAYATIPDEGAIKISARMVDTLTEKGLNLGEILRVAAERCSGIGGGHDVAAGAQVPYDMKDHFIRYVDRLVGERLSRGG
ncbi:DHH family phosphoesterase [Candidatus Bathyarchaeota archaeon]|nr:MAG: DHH family phosphoesterase [Candidatus Bathyarchaeota archaeon]